MNAVALGSLWAKTRVLRYLLTACHAVKVGNPAPTQQRVSGYLTTTHSSALPCLKPVPWPVQTQQQQPESYWEPGEILTCIPAKQRLTVCRQRRRGSYIPRQVCSKNHLLLADNWKHLFPRAWAQPRVSQAQLHRLTLREQINNVMYGLSQILSCL